MKSRLATKNSEATKHALVLFQSLSDKQIAPNGTADFFLAGFFPVNPVFSVEGRAVVADCHPVLFADVKRALLESAEGWKEDKNGRLSLKGSSRALFGEHGAGPWESLRKRDSMRYETEYCVSADTSKKVEVYQAGQKKTEVCVKVPLKVLTLMVERATGRKAVIEVYC